MGVQKKEYEGLKKRTSRSDIIEELEATLDDLRHGRVHTVRDLVDM